MASEGQENSSVYGTFQEPKSTSRINRCVNWLKKLYAKQSSVLALSLICLALWGVFYSLFKDDVDVDSTMFKLILLFILSKIVGVIVGYAKIPPMVGMLLIGVVLKNVGYIEVTGNYTKLTAVLRQLALVNIMLPAGLGLDPVALKEKCWLILNLAIVPVVVEVVGVMVISYFLLDLPWLWGLLLGFLLAAVSPAVIIPCLFELQDLGYGVNKGIHTLVIAASTLNDIICIAFFGIVLGVIFSTGTLFMQIMQGPIVIAIGLGFGIFWGLVCYLIPSKDEIYLVTLRTLTLGSGCVLSAIGSDAIGYGGAGALGCIVAAFVASLGWRKQGWDSKSPVRQNFQLLWKFFEPISFSLIGIEVKFDLIEGDLILWSIITMSLPLLLRVAVSFLSTLCTNLNRKENAFVALCWIPKATVQAALGPAALDIARTLDDETLMHYSNVVIIVAVLSIIITSPIGAVIIMQLGPRFLHRTEPDVIA